MPLRGGPGPVARIPKGGPAPAGSIKGLSHQLDRYDLNELRMWMAGSPSK